jgi:hypothetical protein
MTPFPFFAGAPLAVSATIAQAAATPRIRRRIYLTSLRGRLWRLAENLPGAALFQAVTPAKSE